MQMRIFKVYWCAILAKLVTSTYIYVSLVGGAVEYRIDQLHLGRGVRPLPNVCPGYENNDSETPILELWGMWSTLLLPLLPGLL